MKQTRSIVPGNLPVFAGTLTLFLAGAGTAAQTHQPNVLVILADDMGYGDVGFNGCKDIPTPNIDSIASNGVRFTSGYVTAPQCAPSRAGLLSGIRQNEFGRGSNKTIDKSGLPEHLKLFGDYMHEAGYRTGIVGKWHLGNSPDCWPLARGFDSFYGLPGGGTYYYPPSTSYFPSASGSIPGIYDGTQRVSVTNYLTFVLGDRAVDFVRQKSDKPFFLYLSFTAPHAPLEAPEEYLKKFQHLAVDGEPGVFCAYTKKMIPHPRQVYAAMVSTLDDTIGSVLQALRDSGQERNTLIYFLSDNGGPTVYSAASNGPFRGEKGDLLEGGIRVPFAVQWKGTIPEGKTIDTPVYSLDLLPTSLAAAGMPVAKQLEGVDLLPLLIKGEPLNARQLYWNFPFPPQFPLWGIRDGEWKLVKEIIYNPDPNRGRLSTGKTRIGLYRITDDLQEEHDLSEQYPEVRQRLQSEYDAWASTLPPEPGK